MNQLHDHYQKSGLIPTEPLKSEGSGSSSCSLCPCICGSEAEIDWDGCTDWNGRSWQRVNAGCVECFRSVSIEIDSDSDEEREAAGELVGGMWDEFIKANA